MSEVCECCGASMVVYKHKLNHHLIKGLIVLESLGGVATFKDICANLTYSQRNNFQKLQHFGLATGAKRGDWSITDLGREFLSGNVSLPLRVLTYRNKFLKNDEKAPMVTVFEAMGDYEYWYREDYLKTREAYNDK